jgi:putative endonuclease
VAGNAGTNVIGHFAERAAEAWLSRQGLRTVARNFRTRQGEIDLVMLDGATLVFVEVRYRQASDFGTPEETVVPAKQARIIRAAHAFLQQHAGHAERLCRFDVVSLTRRNYRPEIRWYKDAFTQ